MSQPQTSSSARTDAIREGRSEAPAWALAALTTGFTGAATVALFYLLIDVVAGRPLWTPATLGSALFTGEMLAPGGAPTAVLVLGYTAVHLAVFVAFGLMAASYLASRKQPLSGLGSGHTVALVAVLFGACEVVFLSFGLTFAPGLLEEFGAGQVGLANALAALAMTGVLTRSKLG